MSHLPHVFAYKQALIEQGITCPVELAKLVTEPVVTAIIRDHFRRSEIIGLTVEQEERIWGKLDCWNKISPINAQLAFQTVKHRLNDLRANLIKHGGLPSEQFTTVVDVNGKTVDVSQNGQFVELVDFLYAELVNCDE